MDFRDLSNSELEKILHAAQKEKHTRRRGEQKSIDTSLSARERNTIEEYERRVARGEDVAPLIEKVDLEELVSSEIFERVLSIDDSLSVNEATIRGRALRFYTPNPRALWQSFGTEYIEPELLDFIDGMTERSVYFDIGASTGVFSVYAAAKGINTYCFEPEVANFNILNMNAYLNFNMVGDTLNAFNLALADNTSTNSIFVRKFEPSAHEKILGAPNARDGSLDFDYAFKQRIFCVSVDAFCEVEGVCPTDIKIDVDGAEKLVLSGMKETLASQALRRIFIEISENDKTSKEVLSSLLSFGFRVEKKVRVQNYFDEFNYTLLRD